jgi:hypothetical protein
MQRMETPCWTYIAPRWLRRCRLCPSPWGRVRAPPQKTRAIGDHSGNKHRTTLSKTFGTPNSLDQLTDDVLAAWLMFLPTTSFIKSVRSITPAHSSQFFWPLWRSQLAKIRHYVCGERLGGPGRCYCRVGEEQWSHAGEQRNSCFTSDSDVFLLIMLSECFVHQRAKWPRDTPHPHPTSAMSHHQKK